MGEGLGEGDELCERLGDGDGLVDLPGLLDGAGLVDFVGLLDGAGLVDGLALLEELALLVGLGLPEGLGLPDGLVPSFGLVLTLLNSVADTAAVLPPRHGECTRLVEVARAGAAEKPHTRNAPPATAPTTRPARSIPLSTAVLRWSSRLGPVPALLTFLLFTIKIRNPIARRSRPVSARPLARALAVLTAVPWPG